MNEALEQLARKLELNDPRNERVRLEFGYACAQRIEQLLEDAKVLDCLTELGAYLAGSRNLESFRQTVVEAARLANQHQGSKSIDGCGHAAVSATYAVAKALEGKALEAASYSAYAGVYAQGGYGAVAQREAFEPEFAWQVAYLEALALRLHADRIGALDPSSFDEVLAYLNDHLADNGSGKETYFQPVSRSDWKFPPDRTEAFRKGLLLPVGHAGWRRCWIIRGLGAKILGHVDLRDHAERFAEHRCLLGMGVDRDHRKSGLGRRLIEHVEEWAASSELLEWIDLRVLTCNANAIRLYERAGFTKTGDTEDMFRIDGLSFSYTSMAKKIRKA